MHIFLNSKQLEEGVLLLFRVSRGIDFDNDDDGTAENDDFILQRICRLLGQLYDRSDHSLGYRLRLCSCPLLCDLSEVCQTLSRWQILADELKGRSIGSMGIGEDPWNFVGHGPLGAGFTFDAKYDIEFCWIFCSAMVWFSFVHIIILEVKAFTCMR